MNIVYIYVYIVYIVIVYIVYIYIVYMVYVYTCIQSSAFACAGLSAGFCGQHKSEGMIDVANRRCDHPDCAKAPAFNYPNEQRRLFCASHKLDGVFICVWGGVV
jgi:hypothetical protein